MLRVLYEHEHTRTRELSLSDRLFLRPGTTTVNGRCRNTHTHALERCVRIPTLHMHTHDITSPLCGIHSCNSNYVWRRVRNFRIRASAQRGKVGFAKQIRSASMRRRESWRFCRCSKFWDVHGVVLFSRCACHHCAMGHAHLLCTIPISPDELLTASLRITQFRCHGAWCCHGKIRIVAPCRRGRCSSRPVPGGPFHNDARPAHDSSGDFPKSRTDPCQGGGIIRLLFLGACPGALAPGCLASGGSSGKVLLKVDERVGRMGRASVTTTSIGGRPTRHRIAGSSGAAQLAGGWLAMRRRQPLSHMPALV